MSTLHISCLKTLPTCEEYFITLKKQINSNNNRNLWVSAWLGLYSCTLTFIHLLIFWQIFSECLPHARHCAHSWEYTDQYVTSLVIKERTFWHDEWQYDTCYHRGVSQVLWEQRGEDNYCCVVFRKSWRWSQTGEVENRLRRLCQFRMDYPFSSTILV